MGADVERMDQPRREQGGAESLAPEQGLCQAQEDRGGDRPPILSRHILSSLVSPPSPPHPIFFHGQTSSGESRNPAEPH